MHRSQWLGYLRCELRKKRTGTEELELEAEAKAPCSGDRFLHNVLNASWWFDMARLPLRMEETVDGLRCPERPHSIGHRSTEDELDDASRPAPLISH